MRTGTDRRKRNKDAGFSLVELLIAVVILAIIVIPLLNVFLSSNRLNIKSRKTLRATTAAQDIMEGLKAYDINELKEQFTDPASGFYVIDSRLIKGGVGLNGEDASGTSVPINDPAAVQGLYVFSMKDVSLQGSKFDAKIVVDARGYMSSTPAGTAMKDHDAHPVSPTGTETYKFNDSALADARSIDKKNGTFVESDAIRKAVLSGVFKVPAMENAIKDKLRAAGAVDVDAEYQDQKDAVSFKNISSVFDSVRREIHVFLTPSAEVDKNGDYKVDMKVTHRYIFTCGTSDEVGVTGDAGSLVGTIGDPGVPGSPIGSVDPDKARPFGSIARTKDGDVNVNLFYYPLYDTSVPDKIFINNMSGVPVNLLIAKLRYEKEDPSDPDKVDLSDPEYFTDPQLMAAEQTYRAEIVMNDIHFDADTFSLKTNLGLNLVGQKYMGSSSIELPTQFGVTGTGKNLNELNVYTLDGVRSPLGKDPAPGEATELIYDVEVGIYQEGAADDGFPEEKRMVVIGGSTTN